MNNLNNLVDCAKMKYFKDALKIKLMHFDRQEKPKIFKKFKLNSFDRKRLIAFKTTIKENHLVGGKIEEQVVTP